MVTFSGLNMYNNTRWCSVKTKIQYHSVNPIPEHPACLVSKETARNKACQTHSKYNARWPEQNMEPTEYFITPRKQTCTYIHTDYTCPEHTKNDKETQTITKHNQSVVTILNKCVQNSHVPIHIQMDAETGKQPETMALSAACGSSTETEDTKLAQLLGSFSITYTPPRAARTQGGIEPPCGTPTSLDVV